MVVNSYNRRVLLERALNSIYERLRPLPKEVLIVDDGSTDGSAELVEGWVESGHYPGLRLVRPQERVTFSGGVNLGILSTSAPFVCLFETDNVALDSGLWKVVAHLQAHPRTAAAGVRVLKMDGTPAASSQAFPRALAFVLGLRLSGYLRMEAGPQDLRREVVYTSPVVVSRSALARVGLMDSRNFPFLDSDVDWMRRMADGGYEVHVLEDVSCVHDQGQHPSEFSRRRVMDFHRARLAYFRLHTPWTVPWIRAGLLFRHVVELLLLSLMRVAGRDTTEKLKMRLELVRRWANSYR